MQRMIHENRFNTLAWQLENTINNVLSDIHCAAGGTAGETGLLEACSATGSTMSDRPATDDECCLAEIEILAPTFQVDIRRPIPTAVARKMRAFAKKLLEAADRVERIPDERDRALLRRYVAGDPAVMLDEEAGVFTVTDESLAVA